MGACIYHLQNFATHIATLKSKNVAGVSGISVHARWVVYYIFTHSYLYCIYLFLALNKKYSLLSNKYTTNISVWLWSWFLLVSKPTVLWWMHNTFVSPDLHTHPLPLIFLTFIHQCCFVVSKIPYHWAQGLQSFWRMPPGNWLPMVPRQTRRGLLQQLGQLCWNLQPSRNGWDLLSRTF